MTASDVSAFATAFAQLVTAGAAIAAFIQSRRNSRKINEVQVATNGLLKQRIAVERKDATAEGNLAGRAEAKDEAADRGDVRGLK